MPHLIAIKGSRDGLRLQLDEGAAWDELIDALRAQLGQGQHFFNGAHITVDIGNRALSKEQLGTLTGLMSEYGLRADTLASTTPESRESARSAGIAARNIVRTVADQEDRGEAVFVQRTIRSGQVIKHHGHVTVFGDVNAGGEIIAGGNVIVWGRLRGTVHAGALGNRSAQICALEFSPTQLRIADVIARTPEQDRPRFPEVARVEGDHIGVEAWETYKK